MIFKFQMNYYLEFIMLDSIKKKLLQFNIIIQKIFFGYKDNSEADSNIRRAFSRVVIFYCAVIVLQSIFSETFFEEKPLLYSTYSVVFVFLALVFFCTNVIAITFKQDDTFEINTSRLFWDIIISSVFHIVSFSYVYRSYRILDPQISLVQTINFSDHLYFSAVTFSTLGYGDFRPSGDSRLLAAYEALIGNMHLGFLVGAAFLAASNRRSKRSPK